MNTLNRPLFRQMGGPAAMMPQDMGPPPQMGPSPEEQVMGVEQNAEEAGREYVASMMGGIDSAEDVTSMINALRGNDAPLESRYAELAGYVGEADASQTPESVLAMVQPTLMMTEEGAVDSGIGELMAGLSDSPMETPSGDPTAMGQGVGELMTMGAGSTPPVNFRNGGPVEVRGYQDGTEVRPGGGRVISNAQKMAPDYQKYFAGAMDSEARAAALEEQKRMSKAQIFFDIAQTALAAGAPTATPMSAAERIAGAIGQTQLFDKMGQRSAGLLQAKQAQAAEDRQLRMASLQGALGQSQADEQNRQALLAAGAKVKPGDAKYQRLVGQNGEKLGTFNVGTPDGAAKLDAAIKSNPDADLYNIGTEPADSRKSDLRIVVSKDGKEQTFDLNTAEGLKNFNEASKKDGAKVYNVGTAPTDTGFKTITVYDPANPTVAITKPTNTAKDRELVNGLLAEGYTTDDKIAAAAISEEFTIKKEDREVRRDIDAEERDLATTIAAENRLKITTISKEERAVLTAIASEGRATERLITTEARLLTTTLGSEERRLATLEAKEARDDLAAIKRENRAIKAKIDAEKRNLETTIASEDRATARETVVYGRNRTDELADIEAQVASKIATEERALGRTLDAEERDQTTFEVRRSIIQENDLERLATAQGLRDTSQISAEDRAAIVAQNEFVRDQSAKIAGEKRAVDNRDTIELREMDGELVRVDTLTGNTEVIFGEPTIPDPSMAQVTLPNADGVPVTTVIDITSPQGKALIEKVNAANAAAPRSASYQKVPTASTSVRGFFIPGKGVFTSYDGKTYVDEDGSAKTLPGGAFEVSSTIAYEVAKNEKRAIGAQAELDAMDLALVQGMTKIDGTSISRSDMAEVKDAFAASRSGTGFWSKVYAGLDAVAGGLAPGAFGDLFKDTTDARQFVKMVRVMGRSALASSPRFAVADLQTVEQLFPNEQALFSNPETEARKLNDIVGYLSEEKTRILEMFASGSPMDSTMKSTLNQKIFEIKRLENILGPVAMLGEAGVNQEAIEAAKAAMRKKKN
mgnify:CR=1 FL=1|tara:strand:+ start:1846 stop:4965 length:3120 start_codon:yes stop_codon:yes gene_type:complete